MTQSYRQNLSRIPLFYRKEGKGEKKFVTNWIFIRIPLRLNKRFQCDPKVSKYQPTIPWINDSSQNIFFFFSFFFRIPVYTSHPHRQFESWEVLSHYLIVKARTRKNLGENVIGCPRSLVCFFFFFVVVVI